MKFTKSNGTYKATRTDGQEITIELSFYNEGAEFTWVCRYENDFDGDNTHFAKTKKELVAIETHYENNL